MQKLVTLGVFVATLGGGTAAHAQFAKPEDAIKYRQSALFIMSSHFGRIGAMVKGAVPYDPAVATQNAVIVQEMSQLPWAGFGPGTDQGRETRAKPEIWKETPKFQAAAKRLQEETAKLAAAARTNDLGNLKQAFGATAQACKACHDDFRKD